MEGLGGYYKSFKGCNHFLLVAQDDRKSFRTLGMPDLGEHYSSPPNIPQWGVNGGYQKCFKGQNHILLVTKDVKKNFAKP